MLYYNKELNKKVSLCKAKSIIHVEPKVHDAKKKKKDLGNYKYFD